MPITEILILTILSLFQSIFGVGLLIFGTPAFLLLGYSFFDVLNILLPYSIIISLMQLVFYKSDSRDFSLNFLKFTIPTVILSLYILSLYNDKINFLLLTSLTIIIFSIFNIFKKDFILIPSKNSKTFHYWLIFLGLIHGFTNLGGSLLTLISTSINKYKNDIRGNIASGYLLLGITQMIYINIFITQFDFSYLKYIYIPILSILLTRSIYKNINDESFSFILNILILFYGLYIFFMNI